MKKISIIIVFIISAFVLVSCGGNKSISEMNKGQKNNYQVDVQVKQDFELVTSATMKFDGLKSSYEDKNGLVVSVKENNVINQYFKVGDVWIKEESSLSAGNEFSFYESFSDEMFTLTDTKNVYEMNEEQLVEFKDVLSLGLKDSKLVKVLLKTNGKRFLELNIELEVGSNTINLDFSFTKYGSTKVEIPKI